MFNKDAIEALQHSSGIQEAAAAVGAAFKETQLVGLPDNFNLHDLERHQPNRRRARGTMETAVIEDFAAYVKAHQEEGASVFIDQDNMAAVAVLNLGTPAKPGHADNRAKLTANPTAAFKALRNIVNGPRSQQTIAEFFEDWPGYFQFFRDDAEMTAPKAIAAVRKLTIEALRKLETTENQLSASKSAFESVKASSGDDPIPSTIYFTCAPFTGLEQRTFVLRLSIQTTGDKPAIVLRVVNQEQHNEQMAIELAARVRAAIEGMPVLIGKYTASN